MTPAQAEGLVLRTTPFGDKDLVLQLLTETEGRIGAFARGARGSRKRFRGGLAPFLHVRLALVPPRSGDLHSVRDSDVLTAFHGVGADLHRMAAASRLVDLLLHTLQAGEGGGAAFLRVLRFFQWLEQEQRGAPAVEVGLHRMELLLLGHLGLLPDLDRCARSGEPIAPGDAVLWLPEGGVVLPAARYPGEAVVPLGPQGLTYLVGLQEGSFRVAGLADGQAAVRELFDRTWRHVLGRDLNSRSLYRTLFAPPAG